MAACKLNPREPILVAMRRTSQPRPSINLGPTEGPGISMSRRPGTSTSNCPATSPTQASGVTSLVSHNHTTVPPGGGGTAPRSGPDLEPGGGGGGANGGGGADGGGVSRDSSLPEDIVQLHQQVTFLRQDMRRLQQENEQVGTHCVRGEQETGFKFHKRLET